MSQKLPRNIILYGPPGTGKTYETIYKSLELINPQIDPDLLVNPVRREEAVTLYNDYIEKSQIMFCTFHQSFSYEEFI
jgi:5-methylcytosine-specific restriction enzyme B